MTNKEEKQKTIEERMESRMKSIDDLMNYANESEEFSLRVMNQNPRQDAKQNMLYHQSHAIYIQNEVIIEYLKEIYKEIKK